MNYLKVYNALMKKRKLNPPTEDFEKHHILPKSICPEKAKDKTNIVMLTYRQHYLAHHLLYRYYESIDDKNAMYKMAFAWRRMCKNTNGLNVSLNMYEKAKKCDIEIRKQVFKGEGNPSYGKHFSEESKRKMSEAHKGQKPSEQTKKKISEAGKGRKHSEQTKIKISKAIKKWHLQKVLNVQC